MTKPGRLWIAVDTDLFDSPEVAQVGSATAWTFLQLIAYSRRHMTDGILSVSAATQLGATPDQLGHMVDVGWLHVEEQHVTIKAYEQWNPTKDKIRRSNEERAERNRRYRERRRNDGHAY